MKILLLRLLSVIILPVWIHAQPAWKLPLANPLDTPLKFSAPFGSIRENHFHSGMDLRTNEREGLPVYAIESGWVSRIKIQSGGYGNAIYISHPGGFTSVYGHLKSYDSIIAMYVRQIQFSNEQFEMDHFPAAGKLIIHKGQQIGLSGNTGTSTGPHLHFEIRDSKTEEILNPLFAGFQVEDSLPPMIRKVVVYNLNENRPIPIQEVEINLNSLLATDSGYVYNDTLIAAPGSVGIGVQAIDRMTDPQKDYGIYDLRLKANQKLYFRFSLQRFSFDKTRSVNVHIDYARWKKDGIRIQKLFLDDGNEINLYPFVRNRGKLLFGTNETKWISLYASDFNGKKITLHFPLKATPNFTSVQKYSCSKTAFPASTFSWDSSSYSLTIPSGAIFDTLCIQPVLCSSPGFIGQGIQVGSSDIPLYKSITITVPIPFNSTIPMYKWYMALRTDQRPFYISSEFNNGKITARTNQLGCFGLMVDSIAPEIKMLFPTKENTLHDTDIVRFFVRDLQTGIGSYRLEINGKWALAVYDAKNDYIEFKCDERTPHGKLELVLVVTDKRKNLTTFKTTLNRL